MAKEFFNEQWEKLSKEELSRARARLSGFIEATPDSDKLLREVSIIFPRCLSDNCLKVQEPQDTIKGIFIYKKLVTVHKNRNTQRRIKIKNLQTLRRRRKNVLVGKSILP